MNIDPELLARTEEVLDQWTLAGLARDRIRRDSPSLARALDRLSALSPNHR